MEWTLVTGAAKGLGAQICLMLAQKNHHLLIHYRKSFQEATSLAEKCRGFGVQAELIEGDFSSMDLLEKFAEKTQHYRVKNFIHNASYYFVETALKTPPSEWEKTFHTNFLTAIFIMQRLKKSIQETRGNMISIGVAGAGKILADTYSPAYTSSKLALLMLTKSLAKELAGFGVRVNMVSPGYLENSIDLPSDLSTLPMQRLGTLEEVAEVVAFLLDEKNSYITGQNIEVAGGVRL